MLVLTRRKSEKIVIGEDVILTVTAIGRNSVRLGFESSARTRIVRAELVDSPSDVNSSQIALAKDIAESTLGAGPRRQSKSVG